MTITDAMRAELAHVEVTKPCCRKSETATLLRFTAAPHWADGQVVVEAEVPSAALAHRLRVNISHAFGQPAHIYAGQGQPASTYQVRVGQGAAAALVRQAGLVDRSGQPVLGLPSQVIRGARCDCAAAWRAAVIAAGVLTEGHRMALQVTCPGPETALALAGVARRLGVPAKTREVRGVYQVIIRDGDAVTGLLTRLGAHDTAQAWEDHRHQVAAATWQPHARHAENLDGANVRRSEYAAAMAAARAERALQILGDDVPRELAAAGRLRLQHRKATLAQLAELADPPLSKDAIAGRIRRLVAVADRRAAERGIPGPTARLTTGPGS